MKILASLLLLAVAGLLGGCSTTAREAAAREFRLIKAINTNSRATLAAGDAVASGDPDRIKPVSYAVEAEGTANASVAAATDARLAKVESFNRELLTTLADAASTAIPGGIGAVVIGSIKNKFLAANQSIDAAKTSQTALQSLVDEQKKALDDLKTKQASLASDLTAKSAALDDLKASLKTTATTLSAKVEAMPAEEQAKVKTAILDELRARGISEAELTKLKEKSPAELTALAGTAGTIGLAALAALLRTFGPSRGKEDIDKTQADVQNLALTVAKISDVGTEVKDIRDKIAQLDTQKADHEARLNAVENA